MRGDRGRRDGPQGLGLSGVLLGVLLCASAQAGPQAEVDPRICLSASAHLPGATTWTDEQLAFDVVMPDLLSTNAVREYGLIRKHKTGWYQREPPRGPNPLAVSADEVEAYLRAVPPEAGAVGLLAFWFARAPAPSPQGRPLCVALVRPGRRLLIEVSHRPVAWRPEVVSTALGVQARQAKRLAQRRGTGPARGSVPLPAEVTPASAEAGGKALSDAARWLLPGRIGRTLGSGAVSLLLVVPAEDLGTVPIAALPVGEPGQTLLDKAAIVVAPGFHVVRAIASPRPGQVGSRGIVVGDPDLSADREWAFAPLPGAREEAADVAKIVGAPLLVGAAASHKAVWKRLQDTGLRLVYLATHGVTDPFNPQDGSFIALSGKHLTTREIKKLRFETAPLVVLSACQTGLGKAFQGGVYGMSMAWHFAGAGAVVTTLWNVDDAATRDLMRDFTSQFGKHEPAVALASAMRRLRVRRPDPALWASFTIVGGLPSSLPSDTPAHKAAALALLAEGRRLMLDRRESDAERVLAKVVDRHAKARGQDKADLAEVAQQAAFWRMEPMFKAFSRGEWMSGPRKGGKGDLASTLQAGAAALGALEQRYERIGAPGGEMEPACALRRGQAILRWAAWIRSFHPGGHGEQADAARDMLEAQAAQQSARGHELLTRALTGARHEGLGGPWVDGIARALHETRAHRPARHRDPGRGGR